MREVPASVLTVLHLCVVNDTRDRVFTRRLENGWLLPACAIATGVKPAPLVAAALRRLGIAADVVCVRSLAANASSPIVEWIGLARAHAGIQCDRQWIDLRTLCAEPAVLAPQRAAIEMVAACLQNPDNDRPYFHPDWVSATRAWVDTRLSESGRTGPVRYTVLDATTRRVTVSCDTPTERLYFKGLTPSRCVEALVVRAAQAIMPGRYAPTVGWCPARAWWLTARVKGAPLTRKLSAATLQPLVTALARTHVKLSPHLQEWLRIGVPRDDACEWLDHARWLLQRIADSSYIRQSLQLSEHSLASIEKTLVSIVSDAGWDNPVATLLHNDLRVGNVFQQDDQLAFVDLELCSIGNPMIDVLVFLASFGSLTSAEHHDLVRDYCDVWSVPDRARLTRACSTAPVFLALSGVAQRVRPLRDKWVRLPDAMRETFVREAFTPLAEISERL
jgi:hypothetical protein